MQLSQTTKGHGQDLLSKVPAVTVAFWIIKICATTVGETGGDALSMQYNLGYAVSSVIFMAFFAVTLTMQVASKKYHPFFYWAVVVATTLVGTTMSDFLDRVAGHHFDPEKAASVPGFGYIYSSAILFCGVLAVLFAWWKTSGRVEFENITTRRDEVFYWLTILVSNTLGTALGDFMADDMKLGFQGGAMVFAFLLALVAAAHFGTKISKSVLFWAAYVLTRPLGATLGDTLTKPHAQGGFDLSRIASSLVIAAIMIVAIVLTSRKRATSPDLPAGSPT